MASNRIPSRILLLRHGEKYLKPGPSEETERHLSTEGFARAAALAVYIPKVVLTPDYLFAARATKRSNRSVETLAPLAEALSLPINSTYADDDYDILAHNLLTQPQYAGGNVIVCWHHGKLQQFAAALGVQHPPAWPANVFHWIWEINYQAGPPTLLEKVQMLHLEPYVSRQDDDLLLRT